MFSQRSQTALEDHFRNIFALSDPFPGELEVITAQLRQSLPPPSLSTTHCARQQRFHSKIRNWTELLTHGVENDRI